MSKVRIMGPHRRSIKMGGTRGVLITIPRRSTLSLVGRALCNYTFLSSDDDDRRPLYDRKAGGGGGDEKRS